ncbi:MAG: DUF4431 domain-containing protein [Neisseriaceae bacterium]|nr:DUF4431 domain-containing protein [Neisseriaceae bacterium]
MKKTALLLTLILSTTACNQPQDKNQVADTNSVSQTSPTHAEDIAWQVLKLLDKQVMPQSCMGENLNQALQKPRELDNPLESLSVDCSDDTNTINMNIYPLAMNNGNYFVLYVSNAGVNVTASDVVKTYQYDKKQLTEVPLPFEIPQFAEFADNAPIPAKLEEDLQHNLSAFGGASAEEVRKIYLEEVKQVRQDYLNKSDLSNYTIHFDEQDNNLLYFHPLWLGGYPDFSPYISVRYRFNGETFIQEKSTPAAVSVNNNAATYVCEETATLTGRLSEEKGIDQNEQTITFPAIVLDNPILVEAPNKADSLCEAKYENIQTLQLGLQENDLALVQNNIGKTARVTCELVPEHTAHHHTPVWCLVAEDNQVNILN